MSKYSLKNVFYKNKSVLNEMAIITQSNFIERVINAVNNKPQIAGVTSSELETLKQKSPNSDLNKLEDSISKEILRCVYKTNLLNLTGKENKKARKQAEVLIIKQLRKYKNIDNSPIDFKKCLVLFDKIADYIENAADVDLSECIKIADIYMKEIYTNSLEDEKREVEKGEFSFETVIKKSGYYTQYYKEYIGKSIGEDDIYEVHDSDDWKIVFPCTPTSFAKYAVKHKGPDVLTWCTLKEEQWFNYMANKFLFIAIHKKSKPGWNNRYSLVSLKVHPSGEIDFPDTCCRRNDHVDADRLDSMLDDKLKEDVRSAVGYLSSHGFGPTDSGDTSIESIIAGLRSRLGQITEIRNTSAIKNVLLNACLRYPSAIYLACKTLVEKNIGFSTSELQGLLVDFTSEILFDNWQNSRQKIESIENILKPDMLGVDINSVYKEKILDPRAHPRYLIGLLTLDFDSINNFSNEEIKEAIRIALETNNENNFNRTLSLLLKSNHFKNLIELDNITSQKELVSETAKEIISIVLNSKGNKKFVNDKNYKLFEYINVPDFSAPGFELYEAQYTLGHYYYKNQDKFSEIVGDRNNTKEIESRLLNSSLQYTFKNNSFQKNQPRIPGIDIKEYNFIVENMFLKFDAFNKYFDLYTIDTLAALFVFITKEMIARKNNIPIGKEDFSAIFEKIVENLKDKQNLILQICEVNQSDAKYMSDKTINIFSNVLSEQHLDNLHRIALRHDEDNKTQKFIFVLIKSMDKNTQIKIIYKYLKLYFEKHENRLKTKINETFVRRQYNDTQLKDICASIISLQGNIDEKFQISTAISNSLRNKDVKDDCFTFVFKKALDNHFYFKANDILKRLSFERVTSGGIVQIIVQHVDNFTNKFETERFGANQMIESLTEILNENNQPFPKEALSKIILARKKGLMQSRDYVNTIKNFISVPREVRGKDLAIIRDTLVKIYRKNLDRNFYNDSRIKSFVVEKIKEMPRVARGHMQLAFPELASQLRARTPEEEAEQAARNETLLRQYIKLLMS